MWPFEHAHPRKRRSRVREGTETNGEPCRGCADENSVSGFPSDTRPLNNERVNSHWKCVESRGAIVEANDGAVVCQNELTLNECVCVTLVSIIAPSTITAWSGEPHVTRAIGSADWYLVETSSGVTNPQHSSM